WPLQWPISWQSTIVAKNGHCEISRLRSVTEKSRGDGRIKRSDPLAGLGHLLGRRQYGTCSRTSLWSTVKCGSKMRRGDFANFYSQNSRLSVCPRKTFRCQHWDSEMRPIQKFVRQSIKFMMMRKLNTQNRRTSKSFRRGSCRG